MASGRIARELQLINQESTLDPESNTSVEVYENDLYHWKASILGPAGSPYENGIFVLDIQIPQEYPFLPPKVTFITPIYHPNINAEGKICLDILHAGCWSPERNIQKLLTTLVLLLTEPNLDDPIDADIANLYLQDRAQFYQNAKHFTEQQGNLKITKTKSARNACK